jgi:hypothetical protein
MCASQAHAIHSPQSWRPTLSGVSSRPSTSAAQPGKTASTSFKSTPATAAKDLSELGPVSSSTTA